MRPKIICHMTSSIDGRLLVDRWLRPDVTAERKLVSSTYDSLAAELNADGWMVGRKSMEDYASGVARTFDTTITDLRKPFVGNRNGRNVAVAIDLQGKLHYGQDNAAGDHVIAVLGTDVSDAYLAELRHDGVSYLFTAAEGEEGFGSPEGELAHAMDVLGKDFGIKTVMLQGGGVTNGMFLKAELIDEISLIIYPGIDGLAGIPTIFDYHGQPDERPAKGQVLEHIATRTLDSGLVWIRYSIGKKEDENK